MQTANAPVTWGIWGRNSLPEGRTPEHVLHAIADAGYGGVELGPTGFFAGADDIAATIGAHGLSCAGMYAPLRVFENEAVLQEDLDALAGVVRTVQAAGATGPVIIAEETSERIQRAIARGRGPSMLDLDDDEWHRLTTVVELAGRIVSDAGLVATFHPHTGTHVEQPWETDRLLESTSLGLTLDTGHVAAGGDDPRDLLRRWSDRVAHVHIKDVTLGSVRRAQREERAFSIAEASVPLGEGNLDLTGFLADLRLHGYDGWLVVEQDRRPDMGHDHAEVDREQARNLTWLDGRISDA